MHIYSKELLRLVLNVLALSHIHYSAFCNDFLKQFDKTTTEQEKSN